MKRRVLRCALVLCPLIPAAALAEAAAGAPAVDLTPLLQAVVSLSVTLITAFLIPWMRSRYSADERRRLAAAYETIVYAAEQLYGAGRGDEKLDWVTGQLEKRGIKVDRAAIEAEVKKMQALGGMILSDGVSD